MSSRAAFTLEKNLALMAGAGAGKTHRLVTLCLHLLGGARPKGPLEPARLCLLTFTDKAAAEMRSRLRLRLEALARGIAGPSEEPDLAESFSRLNTPFPPARQWQRILDELSAASIGTFHSLCVQLLRRVPAGFGVDPGFELLEEREARNLTRDLAERLLLEKLEAGQRELVELCREWGFESGGKRKQSLVDQLINLLGKVREEGVEPLSLEAGAEPLVRAEFDRERVELAADIETALAGSCGKDGKYRPLLLECRAAISGLTLENFLEPGRFPKLLAAVARDKNWGRQSDPVLKRVGWRVPGNKKQDVHGLGDFYADWAGLPYQRAFLALLTELRERHRQELLSRGVMDFSELLIRTRDLLRDHREVRAEVQDRIGALLVDEFQDTNLLQAELVTLLGELRQGAPRALQASTVFQLPLEPGFLCVVGDAKQSIYEFRGADVSVFGALAQRVEAQGGARAFLQDNRRSTPELIAFFNGLFSQLLRAPPQPRDYEIAYVPEEDDLRAVRGPGHGERSVVRLAYSLQDGDDARACREADAEAVAAYLAYLLDPSAGQQVEDRRAKASRQLRGGDVALLFRRFTYLETYRQALVRKGIPHRVVRGRGFYGAQEVLDLASLLALLGDPSDSVALAAVLRSPLVALSDTSLFLLARRSGGAPRLSSLLLEGEKAFPALPAEEKARLERFFSLHRALRAQKDRLGIAELLQAALEQSGYRVAMAGTPFGEQALANLDKLIELARRHDQTGSGECAAFARELLELAELEPSEAQGELVDSGDPRAVTLLTIHQAKGLEWPVVILPELSAKHVTASDKVLFDRRLGLALKPWLRELGDKLRAPRFARLFKERRRRDEANTRRLLYVAATRARDRLVLTGNGPKNGDSWWRQLDQLLADSPKLRAQVRDLPVEEIHEARPATATAVTPGPREEQRVEAAVARARSSTSPRVRKAVLPVSALQELSRCPRRYHYVYELGLGEFPIAFDHEAAEAGGALDPRSRGTLAHLLLEKTPLELVAGAKLGPALEELVRHQGLDPRSTSAQELLSWVLGFWKTPFGQQLAAAGESRVHRELPFVLRLGEPDALNLYVKGQIDLLFEAPDGSAVIIDYKASGRPAAGLVPYEFQLRCYALAARRMVKDDVPLKVGISFLREADREPLLVSMAPEQARGVEARLLELAQQLLSHRPGLEWSGLDPSACRQLGCGYLYRCHPEPKGL